MTRLRSQGNILTSGRKGSKISPAKSGGEYLIPNNQEGLYDRQGMLFIGSYSLLLVLYSTAVINLNCLLGFFFNSCFHVLSSRDEKVKKE